MNFILHKCRTTTLNLCVLVVFGFTDNKYVVIHLRPDQPCIQKELIDILSTWKNYGSKKYFEEHGNN